MFVLPDHPKYKKTQITESCVLGPVCYPLAHEVLVEALTLEVPDEL